MQKDSVGVLLDNIAPTPSHLEQPVRGAWLNACVLGDCIFKTRSPWQLFSLLYVPVSAQHKGFGLSSILAHGVRRSQASVFWKWGCTRTRKCKLLLVLACMCVCVGHARILCAQSSAESCAYFGYLNRVGTVLPPYLVPRLSALEWGLQLGTSYISYTTVIFQLHNKVIYQLHNRVIHHLHNKAGQLCKCCLFALEHWKMWEWLGPDVSALANRLFIRNLCCTLQGWKNRKVCLCAAVALLKRISAWNPMPLQSEL
jgi:hypothetical protein